MFDARESQVEAQARGARCLINLLIQRDVRDLVVSPGSRSTPLVMAALERSELRLHAIVDERAAAFFALGLRQGGRLSALLSTSGSAAAHWHPALVESEAARLGLLLLTADRPRQFRGRGAPQATEQRKLFGPHAQFLEVELSEGVGDLDDLAQTLGSWRAEQNLHVNLPLAKPLALQPGAAWPLELPRRGPEKDRSPSLPQPLGQVLIIAGSRAERSDAAEALAALALALGAPVVAESASGFRHHPALRPHLIPLNEAEPMPDLILRIGRWPTAKTSQDWLLAAHQARVAVIRLGRDAWPDPLGQGGDFHDGPLQDCLEALLSQGIEATVPTRQEPAAKPRRAERLEGDLLRSLAEALDPEEALVLGNSLTVRRFDEAVDAGMAPTNIYCNRGVCGIDGQLAFSVGLATALNRPLTSLIGDIALFHDLNSLRLVAEAPVPVRVVLINNGGGRIFDELPAAQAIAKADHRRFFTTPQDLDHRAAAELFALPYQRVCPGQEADLSAWFEAGPGSCLVELDLTQNKA